MSLTLGSDGQVVNLLIKDGGRGFDPDDVKSGMGLHSMRERAESMGGSPEVASVSLLIHPKGANFSCKGSQTPHAVFFRTKGFPVASSTQR